MAGTVTLTYVFMSQQTKRCSSPLARLGGLFHLERFVGRAYARPTTQAETFPLLPFRALGQLPVTLGKVMGP